jgi:hypothetical protein
MTRRSWVQVNGKLVPKEEYQASLDSPYYTVLPDLPDFVSPIDGKVYRGRAGMREHNRTHDVVPTADLKGLPPKLLNQPYKSGPGLKDRLIHEVNRLWK